MATTFLAKTALRQALRVQAPRAAAGVAGSRRGLSWVKDVTVNVTFINHEVGVGWVVGWVGWIIHPGKQQRISVCLSHSPSPQIHRA